MCWPLLVRASRCRAQAVDAARDKHATRAIMEEAGLPTPRNMLINTAAELPKVGAGDACTAQGPLVQGWHYACGVGLPRGSAMEASWCGGCP